MRTRQKGFPKQQRSSVIKASLRLFVIVCVYLRGATKCSRRANLYPQSYSSQLSTAADHCKNEWRFLHTYGSDNSPSLWNSLGDGFIFISIKYAMYPILLAIVWLAYFFKSVQCPLQVINFNGMCGVAFWHISICIYLALLGAFFIISPLSFRLGKRPSSPESSSAM